jgi:hypothetical protein
MNGSSMQCSKHVVARAGGDEVVMDSTAGACMYELDADLRIRSVDSAWSEFAAANGAPELIPPPGPVGQSVFDCIRDPTTAHLYRRLFESVLATGRTVVLPFRCDSPALRRFLEMEIRPGELSGLQVSTRVLRLEARAPLALLDPAVRRGGALLRMCGWCKAVEVAGRWLDVAEAVVALRLFERDTMPAITHGICPPCYERVEGVLTRYWGPAA